MFDTTLRLIRNAIFMQSYLRNNITKTYKKSNRNRVNDIDLDVKKIVQKLEIDDRVEKM